MELMIPRVCVLVLILSAHYTEPVTIKPTLCPSNKIAPNRRIASQGSSRTLGAYYDLFANSGPNIPTLQETPEEDDCEDSEDYDEADLSSLTPQSQRRQEFSNRFFFGGPQGFFQRPTTTIRTPRPTYPPVRPPRPTYAPARPPFWSGGQFGNNHYRPPLQHYPSANIKPVHEATEELPVTYRPGVVGVPLGHVVGASPVSPTRSPQQTTPRTQYNPYYPQRPNEYTGRPRPRNLRQNTILGSFIDLLFK